MNPPSQSYLEATPLIETDHPLIRQKAKELSKVCNGSLIVAERIFYFIRDEVIYDFKPVFEESAFSASAILKRGKGFCTPKAILFCALARACSIPAGLHFYDIVDHTLPEPIVRLLKTNTLHRHGIAELYLNDRWIQLDATLDKGHCERKNRIPVTFNANENALMKSKTFDGLPHIEYVQDYGRASDVTFEEIKGWFEEAYPHLFEKLKK